MREKVLTLLFQLFLIVLSLFLARLIANRIPLIPGFNLGPTDLGLPFVEFRVIIVVQLGFHLAFYFVSSLFNREHLLASLERVLKEIYYVIVATTGATCYLFIATTVAFSANFFFFVYIFAPGLKLPQLLL